jgi:hypothetical protein
MSDKKVNTIRAIANITVETPKQKTVYQKNIDIPWEIIMDEIIGNALAKISMTMENSEKNYGNGVSVAITVTLTVNQDEASVKKAFETLQIVVPEELRISMEAAKSLR